MFDFNEAPQQKEFTAGPVPSGSTVLLRLELQKPQYASDMHEFVQEARSGMLGLWAKFVVAAGTYEGCRFFENVWLPTGQQRMRLNEGQTKACNMWWGRVRAIIEANRGVSPKDDSPQGIRKRKINDWLEIHEMEFPAVVGIAKEPHEGRDGNLYWNNSLLRVVTADDKNYRAIMDGGEIIADGPVVGQGGARETRHPAHDAAFSRGADEPPHPADEVPF